MKFQAKSDFFGSRYVKYANRRIYDRKERRYVTLEDIQRELEAGQTFKISAHPNEIDITREVLLDVFYQKEQRQPVLSEESILILIRNSV